MRNFQDTFETLQPSFISAFSIWRTVPLRIAPFTEVRFKQFIFMDNISPSGFTVSLTSHARVPP